MRQKSQTFVNNVAKVNRKAMTAGRRQGIVEFVPTIDSSKCTGCEICIILCPNDVLELIDEVAAVTQPEACTYSGLCQEHCPTEAVHLVYEILFQAGDEVSTKYQ